MSGSDYGPMLSRGGPAPDEMDEIARTVQSDERRRAQPHLEEVGRQLAAEGIPVRTEIREGLPGNAIMQAAARTGLSGHCHGDSRPVGLRRETLGSVSDYVVRHAGDVAVVLVSPAPPARVVKHSGS